MKTCPHCNHLMFEEDECEWCAAERDHLRFGLGFEEPAPEEQEEKEQEEEKED